VVYHKHKQKKATGNGHNHGVLEGHMPSLATKWSYVKDALLQLRNTHAGITTYL